MKFEKFTISKNATIIEAFNLMDDVGKKLLIVTEKKLFVSLLSMGDLQRYLIKSQNLKTKISSILRKKIIYAKEGENIEEIKSKIKMYRTEYMPVVSKKNEIVDVVFWEDFFDKVDRNHKKVSIPVVIMAGGKGTRLRPITNIIPKPLIPLGDKTMIEHIITNFISHGVKDFYISVNYKSDMIQAHLNNKNFFKKINLNYFKEDQPLGTAGSLKYLDNKFKQPFFVTNCDVIIDQDLGEFYNFHKTSNNDISIIGVVKKIPISYGTLNVEQNGILKSIDEKPDFTFQANAGIYIINPDVIKEIEKNKVFHITDLISKILNKKGKVGVFPISDKSWSDIGEWSQYRKTLDKFGYQSW